MARTPIPAPETVAEYLRRGEVPFGGALVRWGARVEDVTKALGRDLGPVRRRWRQLPAPPGVSGTSYRLETPVAWRDVCSVELEFLDDALHRIEFEDAGWRSEGDDFASIDYGVMLANYRQSRDELERLLGAPSEEHAEHESALSTHWVLGEASRMVLYCESRTPQVAISLRPSQGALD